MGNTKKVLVVDDSRTIRQQVSTLLVKEGFEVLEAQDGLEGLARIRGAADLSLVLCDINMPGMTGLEMLEALRALPQPVTVPVVMLTTEGRPDLIDQSRKSGAKGWIVKPFRADQLTAIVRRIASA